METIGFLVFLAWCISVEIRFGDLYRSTWRLRTANKFLRPILRSLLGLPPISAEQQAELDAISGRLR